MGSSPKELAAPYVGLTILLWGIYKSLKAKPTSREVQAGLDRPRLLSQKKKKKKI